MDRAKLDAVPDDSIARRRQELSELDVMQVLDQVTRRSPSHQIAIAAHAEDRVIASLNAVIGVTAA